MRKPKFVVAEDGSNAKCKCKRKGANVYAAILPHKQQEGKWKILISSSAGPRRVDHPIAIDTIEEAIETATSILEEW